MNSEISNIEDEILIKDEVIKDVYYSLMQLEKKESKIRSNLLEMEANLDTDQELKEMLVLDMYEIHKKQVILKELADETTQVIKSLNDRQNIYYKYYSEGYSDHQLYKLEDDVLVKRYECVENEYKIDELKKSEKDLIRKSSDLQSSINRRNRATAGNVSADKQNIEESLKDCRQKLDTMTNYDSVVQSQKAEAEDEFYRYSKYYNNKPTLIE